MIFLDIRLYRKQSKTPKRLKEMADVNKNIKIAIIGGGLSGFAVKNTRILDTLFVF